MSNLSFSVENNVAEITVFSLNLWKNGFLYLKKECDIIEFTTGFNDKCYNEPLYYVINKLEYFIDCVIKGVKYVSMTIDGYELFVYQQNKILVYPMYKHFEFHETNIDLFNKIIITLKKILKWLKNL